MDVSAVKASLGRWEEAVNQPNRFAPEGCNIFEYVHELGSRKVANLATPEGLHPFHIEVFKEQMSIAVGQVMGQFEEPVPSLVDYGLINAGNNQLGFLPIVRELDLACHLALGLFQFSQSLSIEQWAFNLFAVRCDKKSLQPKVKACAFTCHGLIVLDDLFLGNPLGDKVQIEIAKTVTLNGDGLNTRWYISAFAELVDLALNADIVPVQQLPTGLLEGETTVLFHLLKAWWGSADFPLEVAKEQSVGSINAVNNVLNRLATNHIPVLVAIKLFQFGKLPTIALRIAQWILTNTGIGASLNS